MNNNQTYTDNYENTYATIQAPAIPHPNANAPRYAAPRKAKGVKIPGRSGAIARLIVMFLAIALGLFSIVASIFTTEWTFGQMITDSIWGIGIMSLLGAWFWGIMKWIAFIAPKSWGWAKAFWRAWIPLTFFGLYIKAMIFLVILLVPISASFASNSLLVAFAFSFADGSLNFFSAFGTMLLGIAAVAILTFLDFCKIKGWSAKGAAKELFNKAKRSFAERKQ